jgi:class 3 adenylate cyclase
MLWGLPFGSRRYFLSASPIKYVHVKEAVYFSLYAMEAVQQVYHEKGTQLQTRTGIHTGRPVVVGVLQFKKHLKYLEQ